MLLGVRGGYRGPLFADNQGHVPKALKEEERKGEPSQAVKVTCLKIPFVCFFSPTPSSQLDLAGPTHRGHSTV